MRLLPILLAALLATTAVSCADSTQQATQDREEAVIAYLDVVFPDEECEPRAFDYYCNANGWCTALLTCQDTATQSVHSVVVPLLCGIEECRLRLTYSPAP